MELAQAIAETGPKGLADLIKLLLRPLQAELLVSAAENPIHGARSAIERPSFFAEGHAPSLFSESMYVQLPKENYRILLASYVVLPCPWERSRLTTTLAFIGNGKRWGKWQQDSNHAVTIWLPWGLAFVNGGNHSITAGILNGEGELTPREVFDMSPVLDRMRCDGRHYFNQETGKIITKVTDHRIAAVFEIGRLMRTHGVTAFS